MKTEKVVLAFIASIIGILVAAVAFYFYQSTKTITLPGQTKTITITTPTPTNSESIFLSIDRPKDEEVSDKKTITVSGKTVPNAIVIISLAGADDVIKPATDGSFNATETITDGQNHIEITAIAPSGEETTIVKTVTFSTENF